jgi:hypothetical protein
MSDSFDDFWSTSIGSMGILTPESVAAIRSAIQTIYSLQVDNANTNAYARAIRD